MTTSSTPNQDAFAKVIAKAWADEAYKQRLTDDPRAVLTEAGLNPPDGVEVKVVENTDSIVHFVLPPAPAEGEISEEALSQISGGTAVNCMMQCVQGGGFSY